MGVSMKTKNLKRLVTIGFGIIQLLWIFWFFGRAVYAYSLMIWDWNRFGMPLDQLGIWSFELVWVGILPFVIICLAKKLVQIMIDKTAFTQVGYKLSLGIFFLTGTVVLSSLAQDFFYYQVSELDLISFVDKYILQYMGAFLVLFILLILNLVIKNGLRVRDEMDGFI